MKAKAPTPEDRQRLNLRTIATTFRAAMASAPHHADRHRERSVVLLDRAHGAATSDAIRGEIDDLRSEIGGSGGQQTG